jgi:hypothetical protein
MDDTPKYTISASTVGAVVRTGVSLVTFAVLFFGTLVRLLSAHDLAGVFRYLQQQDTISGLTMAATVGWFVWRTLVAAYKKRRDVEIAHVAPDAFVTVDNRGLWSRLRYVIKGA